MWNGKMKAITFSYDDAVTQDVRLTQLFHKYGLKATFNLNSERLGYPGMLDRDGARVSHYKLAPKDVAKVYEGHEIAAHTLTHPNLTRIEDDAEVIRQVEEDRLNLSELAGYEVVGFAYPCGGVNNDDRVAKLIRENTGIQYARTITQADNFDLQENLFRFKPTAYHHMHLDELFELADRFLSLKADKPQMLYIWGHAYEFDIFDDWARFEELCKMISGKDDIFYGTNKEVLL